MTKYEVGVYLTSFNVVNIEAGTEREAKDIALKPSKGTLSPDLKKSVNFLS